MIYIFNMEDYVEEVLIVASCVCWKVAHVCVRHIVRGKKFVGLEWYESVVTCNRNIGMKCTE